MQKKRNKCGSLWGRKKNGVDPVDSKDTVALYTKLNNMWPKLERDPFLYGEKGLNRAHIMAKRIAHLFEPGSPPSEVRELSKSEIKEIEARFKNDKR